MIRDNVKRRKYFRDWATAKRTKIINDLNKLKLELGCKDCGYKENHAALQFDHLPQFKKVSEVSSLAVSGTKALEEELAKCEVVCANCHCIRTANRRIAKSSLKS